MHGSDMRGPSTADCEKFITIRRDVRQRVSGAARVSIHVAWVGRHWRRTLLGNIADEFLVVKNARGHAVQPS
jgi:hypothetical protein